VLLGFSAGVVTVALSPDQYFGFLIALLLIFGVSFELPLLVVMLNQVGVPPGRTCAGGTGASSSASSSSPPSSSPAATRCR